MNRFAGDRRRWLGAAAACGAAVLNPWTVGRVATNDGSIDQIDVFAVLLLVGAWLLFAALQLFWRWVERVSWVQPVGLVRGAMFTSLAAVLVAGTYWQIASYDEAHQHTHVRPVDLVEATPEQRAWADDFYRRSLAAALKHGWFDFDKAMAQGFQPDRVNHTHFPNLEYMFDDVIMDPERPEWLVYDQTPDGKVLMALMFFTRTLDEVGPTPAGPLALWHRHPYKTAYCAVKELWTIGPADRDDRCAEGVPVTRTPEMFHVWFIDHPLGRFTEMKIVPEYWEEARFDLRLLHPVAVHFSISLFVVAVLLDIAGIALRKPALHAAAWINLSLAAIAAIATVSAGMTAETLLAPTPQAHETLDLHKLFGFSSFGAILLLFVWRYALRGRFPRRGAVLYAVLGLTSIGIVSGAGYYGGEMVYRHGAAVRATDTFLRERYWKQVREIYRNPAPSLFEQKSIGASVVLP